MNILNRYIFMYRIIWFLIRINTKTKKSRFHISGSEHFLVVYRKKYLRQIKFHQCWHPHTQIYIISQHLTISSLHSDVSPENVLLTGLGQCICLNQLQLNIEEISRAKSDNLKNNIHENIINVAGQVWYVAPYPKPVK